MEENKKCDMRGDAAMMKLECLARVQSENEGEDAKDDKRKRDERFYSTSFRFKQRQARQYRQYEKNIENFQHGSPKRDSKEHQPFIMTDTQSRLTLSACTVEWDNGLCG